MKGKTVIEELEEMNKRFLKPKIVKDDGFYQMCDREMKKQKKKVI